MPFNREQMASYLNVERSALSKELGKMKKEGLINFHRNRFCLLKKKIQN
ncbi:helix-turn-helix domain-containing protein [Dubosiella newyorkensis]